jgi:alcohol dehydrogenase
MKAAFIRKYGNNEVVEVGDLPTPAPGPSDLLVRVHAASVNPVDFKIRDGMLKTLLPCRFPLVLGNDLAGTVAGVGSAVARFKKGDEIFARLDKQRIGSFAEYALVDESNAATKPANLRFDEASSIPLVGLTSWQALIDSARLSAGQKVLIHAGSGGVGTFAIQLAKYLGATVATTVSERNIELVRRLGADIVIDYRRQRFDDVLRDYDVVFDTLGEDTQLRSFTVLKRGGVLVTIAGVPTARFMREWGARTLVVLYAAWANRKAVRLAKQHQARFEYLFMHPDGTQLAEIGKLLSDGRIVPVIDKVFSLDLAREALAYSESGRAVGKVIIQP